MRGRRQRLPFFSRGGPASAAGNHGGSMLFLRGADHENRARFAQ
jgi:hypothetical protein